MSITQRTALLAVLLSSTAACIVHGQQPPLKPAAKEKPLTDAYGDPLPPGAIQRIGTVRLIHGAPIDAVFFSPNGKSVTAIDCAGHVRVWEIATGKEVGHWRLESKDGCGVVDSVLSPDGRLLAGNSFEGISLWDTTTGNRRAILKEDGLPLDGCVRAFTTDGKTILVQPALGCRLESWDVATGRKRSTIELEKPKWAKNGRVRFAIPFITDVSTDAKLLASIDLSTEFYLFDAATGKLLRRFQGHPKRVWRVLFSPDGKFLASGCEDGTICLWQARTGKMLKAFRGYSWHNFTFTADSKSVILQASDNAFHVFDIRTGKRLLRRFVGTELAWKKGSLTVSPDGKILAACSQCYSYSGHSNHLFLWDMRTGKLLGKGYNALTPAGWCGAVYAPDARSVYVKHANVPHGRCSRYELGSGRRLGVFPGEMLDLSRDGKRLAAAYQGQLRMYDVGTEKLLWKLRAKANVQSARFSANNAKIVFATENHTYHVVDSKNGKFVKEYTPLSWDPEIKQVPPNFRANWVAYSPNLKYVALSREKEGITQVVEWKTGKIVHQFKHRLPGYFDLTFSPDGQFLFADQHQQGILWHIPTSKKMADFQGVCYGDLSPDGRVVYLRMHETLLFWDVMKRRLICRLRDPGLVDFSSDGKLVVSYDMAGGASDSQTVDVWELATGKVVKQIPRARSCFWHAIFAPDNRTLMTITDSSVLIWDLTSLRLALHQQPMKLTKGDFAQLWQKLASKDAAEAYQGLWRLVAAGDETVTAMRKVLSPVKAPPPKLVAELIADLDSDKFKRREMALKKLSTMEAALPALRKAMSNHPTLEAHLRMEKLIAQLEDFATTPELLRQYRAVQVLEYIGSKEARGLLRRLATGVPHTMLTREAKATLKRLAKRQR